MQHHYQVSATWTGNQGEGTTGYKSYARDVTLQAPGKPDLLGSADKPFRGDPQRWNPEEMFLAALAQCHLLSYLHCCVTQDVVVLDYRDQATGQLLTEGNSGRFVGAVLRPEVRVSEPWMVDRAHAAHEIAHQWCFIANSVSFPVRIEPTILVGQQS